MERHRLRAPRLTRRRMLGAIGGIIGAGSLGTAVSALFDDRPSTPTIIGHRGAAGLEPPNTIAAIDRALLEGADGVEIDVRRTRDGELILFHDFVLDITTDGHGFVEDTDYSTIQELSLDGEPIPTLEEALIHLADTDALIYLELKSKSIARDVVEAVQDHGLEDRTTIVSFDAETLEPAVGTDIEVGLLGSVPNFFTVREARDVGCSLVMSHYVPGAIDRFIRQARDAGLHGGIWSLVTTKDGLEDAFASNPDVITTNRPDLAVKLRENESQ